MYISGGANELFLNAIYILLMGHFKDGTVNVDD